MTRARSWIPFVVVIVLVRSPHPQGAAPPCADAATELARGLGRLAEARSMEGERERLLARLAAVDDLRRVRTLHPGAEPSPAVEAARRAARELAALGLLDEAEGELEAALTLDPRSDLAPSLEVELADVERRRGALAAAAERYARAALDPRLDDDTRETAQVWRGRLAFERGADALGVRLLSSVAAHSERPERSIEAFDRLARASVARGDLEGAAGWLESARTRWSRVSVEMTPRGDRTRRALMRMGAVVELRLAVFERDAALEEPR